jgi:uncharacterized membrane protein
VHGGGVVSAQLCAAHREILAAWAVDGIPDDPGTRRYAIERLLPKLWAAHVELQAALAEMVGAYDLTDLHQEIAEVLACGGPVDDELDAATAVMDVLVRRGIVVDPTAAEVAG